MASEHIATDASGRPLHIGDTVNICADVGHATSREPMLAELRALRAAALSDEEREALLWLAGELRHYRGEPNIAGRAREALTRLTGGAP